MFTCEIQVFRTWQRKVQEERQAAQRIQKFWRRTSMSKSTTVPLVHIQNVEEHLEQPISEEER